MMDKNTKIKIEGIPKGYTERTHSGSSSIFYPKGKWNKSEFEHKIKAPEKGLKSELIDGEWYWVCGCPPCLGIHSEKYAYHVCEKHDICIDCGKTRKEITEIPWGISGVGFRCRPCQNKLNKRIKIEALQKFESEEHDDFDFCYEDQIICPHCGTIQSPDDRYESQKEIECETCNGCFDLEVEYSASYSTSINGERVTLESVLKEPAP